MDREYQQLRFDISEKVRLHPQQPGIKTLVELDLYPDVEIEDQETHLRIHGYLRLAGRYVGGEEDGIGKGEDAAGGDEAAPEVRQEGENLEEIAFVIPVEITLPSDRVDVDRIAAEVESFDYQVLSPFELQIEAVLAIDGLLSDPKKDEEAYRDSVVSFAGSSFQSEKEGGPDAEEEASPDEVHLIHVDYGGEPAGKREEPDAQHAEIQSLPQESSASGDEKRAWEQNGADGDEAYAFAVESSSSGESPAEEWSPDSPSFAGAAFEEDADAKATDRGGTRDRENPEERGPASRVRLGFHPDEEDFDEAFQLAKKLLRKPSPDEFGPDRGAADSPAEDETRAEAGEKLEEESAQSADDLVSADVREGEQGAGEGEGLHWARQFLGGKEDTFVKMRMVIVQKGETLDTLAERYGVSASSILRLNGLESGQLEEGQIVYIPGEERKTAQ